MKNVTLMFAIASVALLSPLTAQADGGYLGVSAGKAKTEADVVGLTNDTRTNGTAFKLYGGYAFSRFFGVEGGYANMGRSQDNFNNAAFTFTYHFSSYYLAGTAAVPIGNHFSLFAKAGIANNRVAGTQESPSATSVEFDGGKVSRLLGLGAAVNFTKNFGMRVEYEDFGKITSASSSGTVADINGKGKMWSIGAVVKF